MSFLKPEELVKQLPITAGMSVAELGAGTGAFVIPLAKRVGEKGKVYAIDVNSGLLSGIAAKAAQEKINTVEIIRGDIEVPVGSKLAPGAADLVILANVLYQTDDKSAVAAEAKRVLKNGGLVFVTDWEASFGGLGPSPERVVSSDDVKKLFLNSGFALYNEGTTIYAGDYHYGLLFKKL